MTDTKKRSTSGHHNVLMFAGKGGVGKTTCAAATALHCSSQGEKTLAISTDPTPSLGHIFEAKDSQRPLKILEGLYIDEIGVEKVKQMWDDGMREAEVPAKQALKDINREISAMNKLLKCVRGD